MDKVKIGKYEISRDFFIFLIISVLLGVVTAIENTSLANRLYEELNFTVMQRSYLETPRELPGLLSVLIIGVLNGLGDIRIAGVANILGGIGLLLFGLVPNHFALILLFLVVYSTGQHMYFPLNNSITMGFAKGDNVGLSMGRVQALNSFAIIIASAVLYFVYEFFNVTYGAVFSVSAAAMILAGILFLFIHNDSQKIVSPKRFVFRKEFKLYYAMAVVYGARRQITYTFVPWLIIDVFKQPVTTITMLFFIVCVINIFFKPWFGNMIDKKGERYAIRFEAIIMFIVCIGFAFAKSAFSFQIALVLVGFCYVLDKLMESTTMARATYVRKLAKDPSEIARTLTMGQSMDHIVSMLIPILAGYIWYVNGAEGYRYVFVGALVISVINFIISSKMEKKIVRTE